MNETQRLAIRKQAQAPVTALQQLAYDELPKRSRLAGRIEQVRNRARYWFIEFSILMPFPISWWLLGLTK